MFFYVPCNAPGVPLTSYHQKVSLVPVFIDSLLQPSSFVFRLSSFVGLSLFLSRYLESLS